MQILRKLRDVKPGETCVKAPLNPNGQTAVQIMDAILATLPIPDDCWGVEVRLEVVLDRVVERSCPCNENP